MKNLLIVFATLAIVLNFTSCKKDKTYQTEMLIGEWFLYSSDGVLQDQNNRTSFIFDTNSVEYCQLAGGIQICYGGKWEWLNNAQTKVGFKISIGGALVDFEIDIESLTEDILKGEMTIDENTGEVELHKEE